jgi:hypothetical protein
MSKVIDASSRFKRVEKPKQHKPISKSNSGDRFWYLSNDLDALIKKKEKDAIRQVLFNLSQSVPVQILFELKEKGMSLEQILEMFEIKK